jgi:hypothetical protein
MTSRGGALTLLAFLCVVRFGGQGCPPHTKSFNTSPTLGPTLPQRARKNRVVPWASVALEIPCPAGERAGLRDDASVTVCLCVFLRGWSWRAGVPAPHLLRSPRSVCCSLSFAPSGRVPVFHSPRRWKRRAIIRRPSGAQISYSPQTSDLNLCLGVGRGFCRLGSRWRLWGRGWFGRLGGPGSG